MQTIHHPAKQNNRVAHYAYHGDEYGIATLVSGGYTFRPEGAASIRLVSYKDPALMLLGHVATADQQWAEDTAHGGLVRTTSRTLAA
jgi:hypothetical protein